MIKNKYEILIKENNKNLKYLRKYEYNENITINDWIKKEESVFYLWDNAFSNNNFYQNKFNNINKYQINKKLNKRHNNIPNLKLNKSNNHLRNGRRNDNINLLNKNDRYDSNTENNREDSLDYNEINNKDNDEISNNSSKIFIKKSNTKKDKSRNKKSKKEKSKNKVKYKEYIDDRPAFNNKKVYDFENFNEDEYFLNLNKKKKKVMNTINNEIEVKNNIEEEEIVNNINNNNEYIDDRPIKTGPKIEEEYEQKNIKLFKCKVCTRKFNELSIQKHQLICKKVFKEKRSKFNMSRKRNNLNNNYDAEAEKKKKKEKSIPKWKVDSAYFRNIIKRNKGEPDNQEDLKLIEEYEKKEREVCPCCDRKFNKDAAKKHIPICKEKHKNKKFKNSRIKKKN